MTISEITKILRKFKKNFGDLDVLVWTPNGELKEVNHIEVFPHTKTPRKQKVIIE